MAQSQAGPSGQSGETGQGDRLVCIHRLMDAIADCDWHDAETIMSAVLEEARVGTPTVAFGEIEDQAKFWARLATYEELRSYFIACARHLSRRKLGTRGRIRLAQIIMGDMSAEEVAKSVEGIASLRSVSRTSDRNR